MRVERLGEQFFRPAWRLMKKEMNGFCPQRQVLTAALRQPNVDVIISVEGSHISGAVIAGDVAARGTICDFIGNEQQGKLLLIEAIQRIACRGVRRIHALIEASHLSKVALLREIGFSIQEGETTMMLQLSEQRNVAQDFAIDRMQLRDVKAALQILSAEREIALCAWEDEAFFRRMIDQPNTSLYVSRENTQVTGVLVGGSFMTYASICHIAVAREHKGKHIGERLVERALEDFSRRGVRRVHLMVTEGNRSVLGFWEKFGFVSVSDDVTTLEYDV